MPDTYVQQPNPPPPPPPQGSGGTTAVAIVAIIVIAALVALFIWRPWGSAPGTSNTTNVNQPNVGATSETYTPPPGTTPTTSPTTT
jgi:flagellar basal body-associated protein FliL